MDVPAPRPLPTLLENIIKKNILDGSETASTSVRRRVPSKTHERVNPSRPIPTCPPMLELLPTVARATEKRDAERASRTRLGRARARRDGETRDE
jgi:hypothetical protein